MVWTGMTTGWYCKVCGADRAAQTPTGDVRKAVENVVSSETIIGPTTGPLWVVVIHTEPRPDLDTTDERHFRAATEEGAVALAAEMVLDYTYVEATQVTNEGSTDA